MAASEATWWATLLEVKRQALLHLRGSDTGDRSSSSNGSTDGGWVKVEAPVTESKDTDWSELWPQQQWQVAFEILFCQMPVSAKSLRPHQDDLLFFVPTAATASGGSSSSSSSSATALLVRRRAKQLPAELAWGSSGAAGLDWRASLLLNLVLQTGYCLAVATCRHTDLPQLVEREGPCLATSGPMSSLSACATGPNTPAGGSSSIREVCKVVYASPSRVHVNLDSSRGSSREPAPCYPDISFAVEDFDQAFSSVVLSHPEDCYCVLLYAEARDSWHLGPDANPAVPALAAAAGRPAATAAGPGSLLAPHSADTVAGQLAGLQLRGEEGGAGPLWGVSQAALGQQQQQQAPRKTTSTTAAALDASSGGSGSGSSSGRQGEPQGGSGRGVPLVFSGFVSHQLLADAMAPKLKGGLLGGRAQRTSRVAMRGPGGLGGADVAVTSMAAARGQREASGSESDEPADRSPALPLLFSRASKAAKGMMDVAKRAAGAGGARWDGSSPLQLKCALMTLLVPVDMLAASVLEAL